MRRRLLTTLTLSLLCCPSLAWNKPGHMVTGAIAYMELEDSDPEVIDAVIGLLKAHNDYNERWEDQLTASWLKNDSDRAMFTFMLACKWADDVRDDHGTNFSQGNWHYINIPYKPPGQPASVRPKDPPSVNLLSVLDKQFGVLRNATAKREDQSISLRWVFHLIGDAHQPLHTSRLFTTRFPNGDRGGTRFYVKTSFRSSSAISLHSLWDRLVIGSRSFQSVRNRATKLRADYPRKVLSELKEKDYEDWIRKESFDLARTKAYKEGELDGGTSKSKAKKLPSTYFKEVKPVADRRVALAGFRLADLMRELFEAP